MDTMTLKQTPSADGLASDHLRALWHDLNGDWATPSTASSQQLTDANAMWIYAYLHRKEPGIFANARYWHRNAGKPFPDGTKCRGRGCAHPLASLSGTLCFDPFIDGFCHFL